MRISMDKYKTSLVGQALKKVYRRDMTISESIELAKREISEVFEKKETTPETDTDTGFYKDLVGKCPLCGRDVIKGKFSYGCTGYKDGCKFKVPCFLCGRAVSISNAKLLLSEGRTSKIQGFISKNGKQFSARLKLDGEKIVFDFDD